MKFDLCKFSSIVYIIFLYSVIQVCSAERSSGENLLDSDNAGAFGEDYDNHNFNSLDQIEKTISQKTPSPKQKVEYPPTTSASATLYEKEKETEIGVLSAVTSNSSNSTTSASDFQTPRNEKQGQQIFGKNITFPNANVTVKQYGIILKEHIPPHQRLQYFDALSDSMRAANRFQNAEDLQVFVQLFYWLLDENYQIKLNITMQNSNQSKNQNTNETNSNSSSSKLNSTTIENNNNIHNAIKNSANNTSINDNKIINNAIYNIPPTWVKKFERKTLKRLLKYALNSEFENSNETPFLKNVSKNKTVTSSRSSVDLQLQPLSPCTKQNSVRWLSKEFYERLLAHTESEGYEILLEAIELVNLTLTSDQLLAIQCLYYNTFQGMQDDRAYIFPEYELDWDLRNTIFGTRVILSSIRHLVQSILNEENSSEPRMSDDMIHILSVFPSFLAKMEAEKKRKATAVKYPIQFYKAVRKLQTKFYSIKKSNNFIDVESQDIIMSTAISCLLESTGDEKKPNTTLVVFSFDNRLDWSHLQLLRLAGTQTFEKFHDFFSKMVTEKITDVYQTGNGIKRYVKQFANTFSRIRMLPTGPLILVGCETLNTLMSEDPPVDRNSISSAAQITKFSQLLQFLRGLYSQDDNMINELPQQVQLLTDPNLNKYLKIMLKYSPLNKGNTTTAKVEDDHVNFAEVGILQQKRENEVENEIVIVPLENLVKYQNMTNYKNMWQFQLGYFRGYAETWQDPVIKMNILLSGQINGELYIGRRSGELEYNSNPDTNNAKHMSEVLGSVDLIADGSSTFWDLFLFPDGQSFQLKWQGGLERFFSVEYDPSGQVPVKLKATHFISGEVPKDFKPAEFFVVPADDYI